MLIMRNRWYGMICCFLLAFLSGFGVFVSGEWDTATFFSNYLSIGIYCLCLFGWKIAKRTSVSTKCDYTRGTLY